MEFADGYEGVTVAGIAILAADTGRFLMAQRAMDETDAPDVQETWEFPGGHLEEGEEPFVGASREFVEELELAIPEGEVINGWRSRSDEHYQGFVYQTPSEIPLDQWVPTEEVQAVAWVAPEEVQDLPLRPEFDGFDWSLMQVSGNQTEDVNEMADTMDEPMLEEPDFDVLMVACGPMYVHGVIAPEDTESGDSRGFNSGAMTSRPGILPFSWQKQAIGGHDGSVVTGSVDRMMRKDGMVHWEGRLLDSAEADEFAGLLAHFGQFGVSVDGDRGSVDEAKTSETGVLWYEAVRAAGLTAVAIPAFAEAYVAFGQHPDMPMMGTDESATMTASGDLIEFARGPGWVTNPRETNRIHDYWTKKGQPGYEKIGWGKPGDFARAKALIGEKIAKHSPEKMRFLNQIIAQWHFDALGYWPATHAKMEKGGAKASADDTVEASEGESAEDAPWEAVLVSSAGERVLPPLEWFSRHPDTDALVIEDPDPVTGLQRTYGYAGEWGICHIGHNGRCTEVPMDPNGGTYPWFHLGRTKVLDENGNAVYIKTGLATYGKSHRSAQEILSETPTQAHFDDLNHAWAALVLGEDERGVWFSGVVLPTVEQKWLTAIEASGQVSGEWKHGELRTLLTVNVPGFPVVRSSAAYDEDGNLAALSASALSMPYEVCEPPEDAICIYEGCTAAATWGVWTNPEVAELVCADHVLAIQAEHTCSDPEPSPKERMKALAQADAEARFAAAKEAWAS